MKFSVIAYFPVIVTVQAISEETMTDDMVSDAVLKQHGKYPTVDVRNMCDNFTIVEEVGEL